MGALCFLQKAKEPTGRDYADKSWLKDDDVVANAQAIDAAAYMAVLLIVAVIAGVVWAVRWAASS